MKNRQLIADVTVPATVSGAALTGNCYFLGIIIVTDGTNDVTLNIYDNIAASGKNLIPDSLPIAGERGYFGYEMSAPVRCINGVYVDITCAGTYSYQIIYAPRI